MEFEKLPVGFAMALAQNRPAMEYFAAMSDNEKQAVLDRAHHVHAKSEMQQIVAQLSEHRTVH